MLQNSAFINIWAIA